MSPEKGRPFVYVDSAPELAGLVARMGKAKRIALDIEADSLHHYFEKVCLIQLTLGDWTGLLDPLVNLDLAAFREALAAKPLILHGADYDLRMLRNSIGFRPNEPVFDSMIAAQLLGYEKFGLTDLVDRFCGVSLSKKGQKSDWSRRPLTEQQMQYAGDDTRYLAKVADTLQEELRALGREEWFRESCEGMVASTAKNSTPDRTDAWRIKGVSRLDRRRMAFVRSLWHWREKEAKKADRPSFKIIGNAQILELALWAQSHPGAPLADGPRLPKHFHGRRLEALKKALDQAQAMPEADWPDLRRRRTAPPSGPDCSREIRALRADCSRIAESLAIPASVLAPRAPLEAIARSRPQTVDEIMQRGPLLRWQATLIAPAVRRVLGKGKGK